MKFRFHRGGLAESLKTTVEVPSKQALLDHIQAYAFYKVSDIKFKHCGQDPRTGWKDQWYVMAAMPGAGADWHVVGFSDGTFEEGGEE